MICPSGSRKEGCRGTKDEVLCGWSAILPLQDSGRVARDPGVRAESIRRWCAPSSPGHSPGFLFLASAEGANLPRSHPCELRFSSCLGWSRFSDGVAAECLIRAAIEIQQRNPTRAIELLHADLPYELGLPNPQFEVGGLLYPVYIRGQAYLELHRGYEAAAEFQKLLEHRNITQNGPIGVLAQLGLARAYAISDDRAKARDSYREFLKLWKDADPEIPILREAQSQYAKLKGR
jgi:tetratricopeptide (TPR) repeat protein